MFSLKDPPPPPSGNVLQVPTLPWLDPEYPHWQSTLFIQLSLLTVLTCFIDEFALPVLGPSFLSPSISFWVSRTGTPAPDKLAGTYSGAVGTPPCRILPTMLPKPIFLVLRDISGPSLCMSRVARCFTAFCAAAVRGSISCDPSHQTVASCLRNSATYDVGVVEEGEEVDQRAAFGADWWDFCGACWIDTPETVVENVALEDRHFRCACWRARGRVWFRGRSKKANIKRDEASCVDFCNGANHRRSRRRCRCMIGVLWQTHVY